MIKQVQDFISHHALLQSGQHVLVAVSGGADSVALLHVLHRLAPVLGVDLSVVHLDHGIRGAAAAADAAFVRQTAEALGRPVISGRADVPRRARRRGISLEMAAREARYAFFTRTARRSGPQAVVATAHTADDQAETVLLRLARGTSPGGLGGIFRETQLGKLRVVRPMLEVTRAQVLAFLRAHRLAWREDETNRDLSVLRNRVRHEILPLLGRRLNPRVKEALARVAELAREEDRWMGALAEGFLEACRLPDGALDVVALAGQPAAARRRVLRRWLEQAGLRPEWLDFDVIGRADQLLCRQRGSGEIGIADGWRLVREYHQIRLRQGSAPARSAAFRRVVRIPGGTVLAVQGLRVTTAVEPGLLKSPRTKPGSLPARASLDWAAVGGRRLVVRSWRPGDRMRPLGLGGSKKIQDIFVDAKVPACERAGTPLFECGGVVIWLPGYELAEGWQVKEPARPALQIRVERI